MKETTWKGIKISRLSKDELIEALEWCAEYIAKQQETHSKDMKFLKEIGDVKRRNM